MSDEKWGWSAGERVRTDRLESGPAVYSLFYHTKEGREHFYGVYSTLENAQKWMPAIWLSSSDYHDLGVSFEEFFYVQPGYLDGMATATIPMWEAIGLSTNNSTVHGQALRQFAERIVAEKTE